MNPFTLVLFGWLLIAAGQVALWLVQRRTNDAGIVDLGWTASLGLLALLYAVALDDGLVVRRWLVGILAAVWSGRLTWYILVDRVLKGEEDGRYQTLRDKWGDSAQRNLFVFFQAQAFLAVILSIQFMLAMLHPASTLQIWDALGALVWLVSVGGESIADRQLARFRADPMNRGSTCREGLWRYSRHPNYFFEWIHWLAYVVISVGSPLWPFTLFAPALMLFFILKVTGIPPTEEQALKSRGDDYRRYQRETSAFFPWFPKRSEL
jgi:steroid 5-alpha reductase family enzyme